MPYGSEVVRDSLPCASQRGGPLRPDDPLTSPATEETLGRGQRREEREREGDREGERGERGGE